MHAKKDRMLSKFVNGYDVMGIGGRIKAKRIFFSNIILMISCFAFLPFALDEIWLVLMITCWFIAGFIFSLIFLKLGRLTAAAVLHLCATAYGIVCLQLFISDSYADTLTFLCLSFIFMVDGLLVSTRMYQLYVLGAAALAAQIAAPLLNLNQKLSISAGLQLENLVLFTIFFAIILLVKLDNHALLRIAKSEKAEKSLEPYLDLLNNSADAQMLLDENQKYTDCNPAALRMFQFESREELAGSGLPDLSPDYQPDGSTSAEKAPRMIEAAEKQGYHLFEWQYKLENGGIIDTTIMLTALSSGQGKRMLCTVFDISGQEKARALSLQSGRMMLLGGIATGLGRGEDSPAKRTLEAAGTLSDRLTRKTLPANLKAAESAGTTMYAIHTYMKRRGIPHLLNTLTEYNTRISTMADNMLNAARQTDTRLTANAPERLLEHALALASRRYESVYDFNGISVKKDYEPDLPAFACEKTGIETALVAILANGAHRMAAYPSKDTNSGHQFIFRISTEPAADMLRIEIEDNGTALGKDERKRVFEPFYMTEPPDSGLDLPIAYFIVTEKHQGRLAVESVGNLGTKFIVQLPIPTQNPKDST